MKCPRCGHDNLPGRKFCAECAAPLPTACPACKTVNEPGAKFCGECGQLLSQPAAPAPPPVHAPPLPAAGAPAAGAPPIAAGAPATAPTAFVNGRYRVKKFLGEGGKKKVYLALDSLLDREVAFALIKTEGLDEAARVRVRREAQAMGRLGAHPHIVTVFDLGEFDGQPYMVTEFMAGGDVEHLIKQAEHHRLPMARCLEIARQIGQGLQFAHAKGIVHRDLKPGNVWLTGDGVAKIGDFGLALSLDRSRLTAEGMMVGTVAYMPPEQALGSPVTPQADLYALGALLYEMVTGRPPFLGDDPVAILGQHIHTPPVAPSWHNPACPRDLEALILRLLAKDPSQRPAHAGDVLAALAAVDVSAVAERTEAETRSLDSLAGGVFVGRQREMGELKAGLEETLAGHGRLVLLVGEPGIGKTRTALELATYAGLRSAQVLWGRCYEAQGTPPYWPWVQAIRAYVRGHEPAQVRAALGAGAADIAEIVSDVRQRLPDLKPPPALDSPEAARFRLFDSIAAFLKSAGAGQPLVLILDDLQWADKLTLSLLQFVAGELAAARVLIVGAYRDVELSRKHPLAQTLGELARERAFRRVLLRGLAQADVARFIELTAGLAPPEALVKAVYSQTEGNPLFVNEVVRLLVQEGELSPARLAERKSWSVRIPEGVREAIGRRLDRLSPRCNEALTVAAVLGREFSLAQMAQLAGEIGEGLTEGLTEDKLLTALEEATAARVIEELPRPAGRYQFTHALIQETLAAELSSARRVRLHARIAQALEALYGSHAEEHAAELAYHFAEAEPVLGTEKLIRYSLAAGERSLATYAHEDAQAHFQRGLAAKEGQPVDVQTALLLCGLGRAEAALHLFDEAAGHLTAAFDYYAQAGDAGRCLAVASVPFTESFEVDPMAPVVERALQLAPPDSVDAGWVMCTRARYLAFILQDRAGAEALFQRALAIAQRAGDQQLELRVWAMQANVAFHMLDVEDEEESIKEGMRLLAVVDSPWDESTLRNCRTIGSAHRHDMQTAMARANESLAAAESLRDRARLVQALDMNQWIAQRAGDWTAARSFSDRILAVIAEPRGLALRMVVEAQLGNTEQAEACAQRIGEYLSAGRWLRPGADAYFAAEAARVAGNRRWLELAKRLGLGLLRSPHPSPRFVYHGRLGLGVVAAEEHDAAAAAEQYAAVAPVTEAPHFASMFHFLGIIAQAAGLPDKAAVHFEEALTFSRKGYRAELAWTCCDYADLLRQRNGPGDGERAAALLEEGLTLARELGMRPLMERILSRRQFLKA